MTGTRGDIWKHTTGRCVFDGGKQYTYDFVGHSAAKTAFTLPHWI